MRAWFPDGHDEQDGNDEPLEAKAECCPICYSRFPDIRGLIYNVGATVGHRCTSVWHHRRDGWPDELELTFDDRFLLRGMLIGV